MKNIVVTSSSTKAKQLKNVLTGTRVVKVISHNKADIEAIKNSIQTYYDNIQKRNKLVEKIKADNKEIDRIKREEEKRLERITRDMTLLSIDELELPNFVARMDIVPKYFSYAPPYKELWSFALETVGSRVKKLFEKTERKFIQDKVDAKQSVIIFLPK